MIRCCGVQARALGPLGVEGPSPLQDPLLPTLPHPYLQPSGLLMLPLGPFSWPGQSGPVGSWQSQHRSHYQPLARG